MRAAFVSLILAATASGTAFAGPPAAPTREGTIVQIEQKGPGLSPEAMADKLRAAAELADQNRRSEALNVEVNRKNREVQARNDATRAAFEKSMADYRAALAAHDAEIARIAADAAKARADYQKRMDDWKADVAACQQGDVTKCAKPAAPQVP